MLSTYFPLSMKLGLRDVGAPKQMLSISRNIGGARLKKYGETIEELSEASKVPLEHMFNSHDNCSSEWCFKTRAPEEGKTYNETDDEFRCKQNDNQLYNILKKNLLPFQTLKVLKESLHMFDKHKNESMNNVIAYVAPKNKTRAHIMSQKNRIL